MKRIQGFALLGVLLTTVAACRAWPGDILEEYGVSEHCEDSVVCLEKHANTVAVNVTEDFEAGNISRPPWAMEGRDAVLTEDMSLSGSYCCRFYLPAKLYENARSELRFHGLPNLGKDNNYGRNFPFFTTWGIHFAVYVPVDFKPDPHREIWAQFHGDPDAWDEVFTPPFAIIVDQYDITIGIRHTEEDPAVSVEKVDFKNVTRVTPGAWHHFVLDLNWDYRRGGQGFCKVYCKKDGFPGREDLIVDYTGPMGYRDANGPYFKIGIYKWSWNFEDRLQESIRSGITERLLYYDDIVVQSAAIISTD